MLVPFNALLASRKFWLAVVSVLAVVLGEFLSPELAEAIVQMCLILIGAITIEDAAQKLNG